MSHLPQATSQAIGSTPQRVYADASGSVDDPAVISNPRDVYQSTTAYHRPQSSSVPDTPGSSVSSCEEYSSVSDWLNRKDFGTSGRQRSVSHLSQRRTGSTTTPYPSPKPQKEQPPPGSIDAWFEQHIEAPNRQATPRKVRDNTLKHLEYPSPPNTFYIYFRGQPGINFQALLSKRRFEYSETPLGQLINFKAVNPPICFKLPDGSFARYTVGGVKISNSMTILEFCIKIAAKLGTSVDGWGLRDLTMVSLELAQNSVICFLGTATPRSLDMVVKR